VKEFYIIKETNETVKKVSDWRADTMKDFINNKLYADFKKEDGSYIVLYKTQVLAYWIG
jgi:hypothetical protein